MKRILWILYLLSVRYFEKEPPAHKLKSYMPELFFAASQMASQEALVVNNTPANAGDARDCVQLLCLEDPLEEEIATRSSTLAWKVPQKSLAGYSPWGQRHCRHYRHY